MTTPGTNARAQDMAGRWASRPSLATVTGRVLLATAGGAALGLAFPPFDLAPLTFVGTAALFVSVRGLRAPARLLLGFLFGLAFFGLLLLWVRRAGLHAYVALVVAESLFPAVFAWLVGPVLGRSPLPASLGASALWVLVMEAGRSRFPLGGFPWGSLGAPLVGTPLALVAPVGGGIAVAWVAAYLSAVLASARRLGLRSAAGAALAALGVLGLGLPFVPGTSSGTEVRVAVVQGNVPLPPEPASPARTARVLADHAGLTRTIAPGSVDLVVWPEGVVDLDGPRPAPGDPAPPPLAELARYTEAWILAGTVSNAGPGRFRNSALSITPSGTVAGVYDKQRPVPFGEYVPGRRFLGFVTALEAVPKDMVAGPGPRLVPVPGGTAGTPISYEVAFSRIVQGFAAQDAGAIVVPTNTSSFGPRAATAEQQLQATRMRALELGLWVVQSAPSGISAIVDPRGHVVARTPLYQSAILRRSIRLATPSTPFGRWGEGPVILLALIASAWVAFPDRARLRPVRHRRHPPRVEPSSGLQGPRLPFTRLGISGPAGPRSHGGDPAK